MSTAPNPPEPVDPRDPVDPQDPVETGEPTDPILQEPVFDEPVLETAVDDEAVKVRRAPRYANFMLLGGIVGVLVALVLTFAFPENEQFDRGQVFGFLLLGLGAVGVAIGAGVALAFDRALAKRAGAAIAEHEETHRIDD
ncbi:hypothetical protein ACDF64_02940 [Agromyces sp. MMS24-JH15]|uniref:hypothetical protein n=1 Tax=Agromyces sp. MMS24-JH15 TaxID=3243765 RepID=UPI00374A4DFF